MSATSSCLAYVRSQRSRFVAELAEFVRFASVRAQSQHVKDVSNCAAWPAAHLRKVGFDRVQVIPTRGQLIVYSDWLHVATSINFPIGLAAIGRDAFCTHRDVPLRSYVANDEVAL